LRSLLKNGAPPRPYDSSHVPDRLHFSPLVAPNFTPQTGFQVLVGSLFAFYTDSSASENISSIASSISYTQYQQTIFPVAGSIWTKGNKYNIQTDWRYLNYPSMTYGLGGGTTLDDGYFIDYHYLRLHQSIFRLIGKDTYVGAGYDYDHYWEITELNSLGQDSAGGRTDYDKYGFSKTANAAGISVGLLYDSRKNQINPDGGSYLNVSFRPKFKFMGSDADWQSLLVEFRHFIKLSANSKNVLALWSYNWLTLGGNPPYLLLPSTGWDANWNTGRGYTQGRFRGKDMVYLEAEYRFGITPDGLLGGVLFANGESFTEMGSNKFEYLAPACGVGLRIKLDKFSRTNFCVDYGLGLNGNGGFQFNIGEVF
jgi:outer membrane protein assembly factor BamA